MTFTQSGYQILGEFEFNDVLYTVFVGRRSGVVRVSCSTWGEDLTENMAGGSYYTVFPDGRTVRRHVEFDNATINMIDNLVSVWRVLSQ